MAARDQAHESTPIFQNGQKAGPEIAAALVALCNSLPKTCAFAGRTTGFSGVASMNLAVA
jgi:hypothetical protein